jgi:hypothetical protein
VPQNGCVAVQITGSLSESSTLTRNTRYPTWVTVNVGRALATSVSTTDVSRAVICTTDECHVSVAYMRFPLTAKAFGIPWIGTAVIRPVGRLTMDTALVNVDSYP